VSESSAVESKRPWGVAALWAVVTSAFFMTLYPLTNWITSHRDQAIVGTWYFEWEKHIPFIPAFIVPYMTIDAFYFGAPFLCTEKREIRTLAKRLIAAISIASICFLLFPLRLGHERHEVAGIFGPVFKFLWSFDQPYNLAPSLHIALRSILWFVYVRHTRGFLRGAVRVWFILIGVSTLFTWQHHVIDIVTGQALAMFCFFLFPDPVGEPKLWPTTGDVTPNWKLGGWYAGAGVVLLLLAAKLGGWWSLLGWPGMAMSFVALAYFLVGPVVFRKRGGRVPLSARFCLAPFLIGSEVSYRIHRNELPPAAEIAPNVLFGRRVDEREARELVARGVHAVLDVTAEYRETPSLRALKYENIQILDFTTPTSPQLRRCVAFIEEHAKDGPVFVHCALGYARSACVVGAYLLKAGVAATPGEAVAMIRKARPRAKMPPRLVRALEKYHEEM